MKTINCHNCGVVCITCKNGELKKRKGIVILCEKCNEQTEITLSLLKIKNTNNKYDLPDGFEKLFGKFK